jgi:hypothetical protein
VFIPSQQGETFEIDRWNGENLEQLATGTINQAYELNSFTTDDRQFIALSDEPNIRC